MSLRKRSFKGSLILTMGQGLVYGLSFARNMLLARMLTKADFGVAATFAMVVTLLEFTGKLGVARFIIRDKEGGNADFMGSAHLMQTLTGALSASLMWLFAAPLAMCFGLKEERWAMWALGIIPLLNGLQHLDIRRFERDLRFGPSSLVEIIPQFIITALAWPLAVWLMDFRVMLFLLILKSAMSCLSSHYLAALPYRWHWNKEYLQRMLRFGWPLLVTSFLMFGVMQGEQFLVATFYAMEDLGPYAAAAALTVAPSFFFGNIFNSIMLPLMAKAQDDPAAFARRYQQATGVIAVFSAACAGGMMVAAEGLMVCVYGEKYHGTGLILALLAAANAFRTMRTAPSLAATAKGDSKNQMISNLWRVMTLIPAFFLAATKQPTWMLAATGLMGELVASRAALARLKWRDGIPISVSLPTFGGVAVVAMAGLTALVLRVHALPVTYSLGLGAFAALLGAVLIVGVTPALRRECKTLWQNLRVHGLTGLLRLRES